MKIIIDRDIPYIRGVLEPYADVEYLEGRSISAGDTANADALIIRTRTKCGEALLKNSHVKLIVTATIGFDHIDMEYCRKAGIHVATAAGSNARGVLQWVGAALSETAERQGWKPDEKCIGVIGVGHVGSLVARYAKAWGFNVLCCDPPRQQNETPDKISENCTLYQPDRFVSFAHIAKECDIITFHTPLIKEGPYRTLHMADESFFNNINPESTIINSSRGEVVDTSSLLSALEGTSFTCCIDTWENEPNIDNELLARALVSTPHIAGYSAQGKANATSMAVQAIAKQFGFPLTEWYPYEDVPKVTPHIISWEELRDTIKNYFDIAAESRILKKNPEQFEKLRNNYRYRTEYF